MKRLEHLGIAVADLAEAERIFTDVLGKPHTSARWWKTRAC